METQLIPYLLHSIQEKPCTFLVLSFSHQCLYIKTFFYQATTKFPHIFNFFIWSFLPALMEIFLLGTLYPLSRVAFFFPLPHWAGGEASVVLILHWCVQIILPLFSLNFSFKYHLWAYIIHYPIIAVICSPWAYLIYFLTILALGSKSHSLTLFLS